MHELGITERIVQIAVDNAKLNHATRISRINVVIGELSNVASDSIRFYFDSLSQDTIARSASLSFESRPARIECGSCHTVFGFDDRSLLCPHCGSAATSIVSGKEFYVESIEVE